MPSYFLTGPDDLLLRERVKTLAQKRPLETHYSQDLDFNQFAATVTTGDLFTSQRAIWLKNIANLPRDRKTMSWLSDICRRLPRETLLVFSQNTHFEGDYRKAASFRDSALRKNLEKAVNQSLQLEMKGTALREWVRQRALERHGLKLTPSQMNRLIDSCLQMPSLIDSELMKFSLLKKPEDTVPVREEVFTFVLTRALGQGTRDMIDATLARDNQAFVLAQEGYRQQEAGWRFFSDLYRGFRRLVMIRSDPQYRSRPEFRGMHQFMLNKLKSAAARWRTSSLLEALTLITQAEFRQRTNRVLGRSSLDAERNLVLVLIKQLFAL